MVGLAILRTPTSTFLLINIEEMDSSVEGSKTGFSFKKRNKCLRTKRHSSESEDEKEEENNIRLVVIDVEF